MLAIKHVYQWASLIAMLASAGLGFRYGGRSGTVIATAMTAAWFLTGIVHKSRLYGLETGAALVDVALFVIVLVTALRSTKWWPMYAAAMVGMLPVLHAAVLYDPTIAGRGVYIGQAYLSYLAMLALGLGSWCERSEVSPTDDGPGHRDDRRAPGLVGGQVLH